MKRPLAYDITRLITRIFARTPNGIDRVDYAFAEYVLCGNAPRRSGLMMTPMGPRVVPLEAVREAIENIRKHWGEDVDPESDPHFLAVAAALKHSSPKFLSISAPRRGQYADAFSWMRRRGIPLGEHPSRFLDGGGVYLNVSQFPLSVPSYFRWLGGSRHVDGVFFIHDLLPLETPEYFRPAERFRHLQRLKTVARHGRGAIVSSAITRKSLMRQMAAMGRPDMPIMIAPMPADPVFSAENGFDEALAATPYFVICGTIEPRKNHLLILQVWRDLVSRMGRAAPKLVLIGERGWENEQVVDLLERSPALQGRVVRVSGLSTPALKKLLLGSRALLMPSFAEGYGLPIVEAMAAGVPVVASDIPIFREIGHGRLSMIDPTDGPAWRETIRRRMSAESPVATPGGNPKQCGPDWPRVFEQVEEFLSSLSGNGDQA
ncbi:MAG TPA: glycosyltransferase family 1 protein [Roseiarcus sp.]|nr:glycosyltransferase family 1 protein [Roseiarcus sp.]